MVVVPPKVPIFILSLYHQPAFSQEGFPVFVSNFVIHVYYVSLSYTLASYDMLVCLQRLREAFTGLFKFLSAIEGCIHLEQRDIPINSAVNELK